MNLKIYKKKKNPVKPEAFHIQNLSDILLNNVAFG